jgi:predicted RNA-binding Zn-ribbon protein involved in translation (DUF1610 family)
LLRALRLYTFPRPPCDFHHARLASSKTRERAESISGAPRTALEFSLHLHFLPLHGAPLQLDVHVVPCSAASRVSGRALAQRGGVPRMGGGGAGGSSGDAASTQTAPIALIRAYHMDFQCPQRGERKIYACPRPREGVDWAGERVHTPSRVPQRWGTTSYREVAPTDLPRLQRGGAVVSHVPGKPLPKASAGA